MVHRPLNTIQGIQRSMRGEIYAYSRLTAPCRYYKYDGIVDDEADVPPE